MRNFEATVDVLFTGKGNRVWYGVTVLDGSLSVGDAVGVTPPGRDSVSMDTKILGIRRNGQATESITVDGQEDYRCALELSSSPADVKVGSHLGMTFIENAEMYGLAADDFI
ncbi:hypothetical protein MTE01_25870 [Microbacterium testaceum]|uniref:Uncharacterized protein n=1 Tax=Microbacterium testaceum TaxID=2033 RepID=A0A4Y3QND6_MICTE|nr:hypothetical protein [Microbacterium testaceum]GEB46642.1 hypothetical protein MTE01_25870 [Microbacterium testaceum]